MVLKDLHAGHRSIKGSKARARLVVYWPQIDNDIENSCRSYQECEKDRPSNPAQPLKHLPAPNYTFEFISADWFDSKDDKFLVLVDWQRWSRGHKARGQGQGHKKTPRPRLKTAFPSTDLLEAKDRNARGQGQGPRTQLQVFPPKKKKMSLKEFFRQSPIYRRSQNF